MAINLISKTSKYGITYEDSAIGVVGSGTIYDRVIADPKTSDGILILSPDQSNAFYLVANTPLVLKLHTGVVTINFNRDKTIETLASEVFSQK